MQPAESGPAFYGGGFGLGSTGAAPIFGVTKYRRIGLFFDVQALNVTAKFTLSPGRAFKGVWLV